MNGTPAFEQSKDGFGYARNQEDLSQDEEVERKKQEVIKDTIESYRNDPTTMCEMIYAIDNEITAENMFGILCSDYVNMRDVRLSLMQNYTLNSDFPERIINNIKCALLQCMLTVYDVRDIENLKKEFLTQ
jgi:hypothetical protein